jgi:predicted ATPase
MTDATVLTERESYIVAQALYEFIRLEQSKTRDLRRWSDEHDAIAILHARFDNELAMLVQSDEAAGCQPPDCERRASIGG